MVKIKTILTIVLVAMLSFSMCGMVFGFANNVKFLTDRKLTPEDECKEYSKYFVPKLDDDAGDNTPEIVENKPMEPYYASITSAGRYQVGVYTKSGNSWIEFDSAFKTVSIKNSSGFYTSLCDYAGGKKNYPFIRSYNGLVMDINYVMVRYD